MNRERIKVDGEFVLDRDINGSNLFDFLDYVRDNGLRLQNEGWSQLEFWHDDFDHTTYICGRRLETDKEYEARMKRLEDKERLEKAKEENERKLYFKLKAKYDLE